MAEEKTTGARGILRYSVLRSNYCPVHAPRELKGRADETHNQELHSNVADSSRGTSKFLGGVMQRCLRCMQPCGSFRVQGDARRADNGHEAKCRTFADLFATKSATGLDSELKAFDGKVRSSSLRQCL